MRGGHGTRRGRLGRVRVRRAGDLVDDAAGAMTIYQLDESSRVTAVTDPLGLEPTPGTTSAAAWPLAPIRWAA